MNQKNTHPALSLLIANEDAIGAAERVLHGTSRGGERADIAMDAFWKLTIAMRNGKAYLDTPETEETRGIINLELLSKQGDAWSVREKIRKLL